MKLKLRNEMIVPSIEFLQGAELKGKFSRARSKLVTLLLDSLKELQESEMELVKEYGETDENGELIKDDKGNPQLSKDNIVKYNLEHAQLVSEIAEVEGGTYTDHATDCKQFLEDYDKALSGKEAQAYDVLLDALEYEESEGK